MASAMLLSRIIQIYGLHREPDPTIAFCSSGDSPRKSFPNVKSHYTDPFVLALYPAI
jgi:hypothetical protein